VTIVIDRRTAAFTYFDRAGNLLTREPARGGKTLTPVDVVVSDFAASTVAEAGLSADGVRIEARNIQTRIDRQAITPSWNSSGRRARRFTGLARTKRAC
jgi:alpha-D-xyloside xylohydrolase